MAKLFYWLTDYSTYLGMKSQLSGEQETRKEVEAALKVFAGYGFKFKEKSPVESRTADIVLMFIKDRHADGKTFHGAGVERGHAYAPIHSEIHFNDHHNFSSIKGDRNSSMKWVAMHEIGHAMGIRHSTQRNAVMYKE